MIPKNLFFIWIGNKLPIYTLFVIDAYKKINSDFNIIFLTFTIKDLENIYYTNAKYKNIYTQLLYESILIIFLAKNEYKQFLYRFITDNNITMYGKDLRFILVLCDIYRLKLINTIGGIYVDLDTFPIKPFDNELLKHRSFIVKRHINASSIYPIITTDNYFLGSNGEEKIYSNDLKESFKILLTNNKWWMNINYIINKKKFFLCKLSNLDIKEHDFYIEHYCDANWKNLPVKGIRTPYCFLDTLYNKYNILT